MTAQPRVQKPGLDSPGVVSATVTLLGGFTVAVSGWPVGQREWQRRHAAALVKILALAPGLRLHREQVIDMLWPDLTLEEAAPRLHKAAHYARRAMASPGSVVLSGDTVQLFPEGHVQIDATTFQKEAEAALAAGDELAAGKAADRYHGDLLPMDPYESWAEDTRARLRILYLKVLRLAGRWERLVTVDPADEEAHLTIIKTLIGQGDRRAALRQYERLERALRQELGVAPSPAAHRIRQQLLGSQGISGAASPATRVVGAPTVAPKSGQLPADRRDAPAVPDSTPDLVARLPERQRLDELLDQVAAGRGRTVFVSGPAGVGKTALLAWLEQRCRARGLRVGTGLAAQVEGAWPYAPVLEALASLCRRHPAVLDGLDDALRSEIERGLNGRDTEWTGGMGHQRLFVAAAELLRLAGGGSGAVLVIDDAHNADDATLRLLHYLSRSTLNDRMLIVVAHRPTSLASLAQIRQSLLGRGTAITIDLSTMSRDDVAALIRGHVPEVDAAAIETVWTASGGLPFAVVEMARAAASGRDLPPTVLLPGLSSVQIEALAGAAVLGTTFDTDEFLAVTSLAEDAAYLLLDAALEHRILIRTSTGYAFRHALVRTAVLDQLPSADRRVLHRRAALALQALNRPSGRIGHHLVRSGDRAQALPWMLRAAETQASLGAYRNALATLQTVRSEASGEELSRLLALRAEFLMAGADANAVDAYREALAATDDPARRSRLRARLARAASFAGDLDTAATALEGLTTDGSPDDAELLVARGHLAVFQGDLEAADVAASEARRRVSLGGPEQWKWFDLVSLQGLVAHSRGEWSQRLTIELRKGVRQPEVAASIFDSHLCVAEFMLYGPTPYQEVLDLTKNLRETAERAGVLRAVAFAAALRGETLFLIGDLATAATELQEAVDLHRDIGSAAGEAHSLQRLAEVKLALGDRSEANRLLYRALPLARLSSIPKHIIQRVYGTMIDAAGSPESARAMVDRAEAALGLTDRCSFCSIMLAIPSARACADVGDIDDAQAHLRIAERSLALWEGTAWQGALSEAKAHLAAARGEGREVVRLLSEAAEQFDIANQPRDAQRCRSAVLTPRGAG